jgi:hypothetical protein
MARKPTINEASLRSLGPKRLAALVLQACNRDDVIEKKVRLMLAAKGGGDVLDAELEKRIKSLASGGTFYDWRDAGDLVSTIDNIRSNITNELGSKNPRAAVVRLWQLIDATNTIMRHVDDSSGLTSDSLQGAVADLGKMLQNSGVDDAAALAERVHASFFDNGYCAKDGLVSAVATALGPDGRAALRKRFEADIAATNTLVPSASGRERDQDSRRSTAARGLMDIANAEHDVDAFVRAAELSPYVWMHVEEAAERLLNAERPDDALAWLERIPPDHHKWRDASGGGMVGLKLEALDALGRHVEAQKLRLQMFERYLWPVYLREYVTRLPDFEDDAVIRQAISHALTFPGVLDALTFLVAWPDLDAAAKLVTTRAAEIDGRHYEFLNPAIEALEEKHPFATTILLRAKIESVLARASSTQYVHAARDLARAAALAPKLGAASAITPHDAYYADLKVKHQRKTSFWPKVQEAGTKI